MKNNEGLAWGPIKILNGALGSDKVLEPIRDEK